MSDEKKSHSKAPRPTSEPDIELASTTAYYSLWSWVVGGRGAWVGPRIGDLPGSTPKDAIDADNPTSTILAQQIESEDGTDIQYRTCSWQKTAALLFSEYICLAIMSFPWSYSVLGLVPGLILTVVVAAMVLYTSLVLWKFCLRHPEVRDACDIGQMLFWGKEWAWWATSVAFVLNNTFIQGLHVLVGAKYLNTMTESQDVGHCRTVLFSVVTMFTCWIFSIPRTFDMMSKLGTGSALFTFVSVVLAAALAGAEGKPAGYDPLTLGEPIVTAFPVKNTTFANGVAAFLNIIFTFNGQITLPSFIAEMRDPYEFPKALWLCTIAEVFVFSIVGAVIYAYSGNQYVTAPAFGSLTDTNKKIAFSLMVPTIIFLGCLYASVTARFIFFRLFRNSHHLHSHTIVGWGSWIGILAVTWVLAFIISQVIPFFNSLLSVMSSLFNSWFGFIFWGMAYFRLRSADKSTERKHGKLTDFMGIATNVLLIAMGIFFLTVGTYTSVQGIIDEYRAGSVSSVFQCSTNGI